MMKSAVRVCFGWWSQPVDATLIMARKDSESVLMSEKCRPGSLRPEKPGALALLAAGDHLVGFTQVLRRPVEPAVISGQTAMSAS